MRPIFILTLLGLYGCAGLGHNSVAAEKAVREIVTKPGDTLPAVAGQHYGMPEYAGLIAYYNDLSADPPAAGTRIQLPAVDELVAAMSALAPHRKIVKAILQGRARFAARFPDLRNERTGVLPGVDKAVPIRLSSDLMLAAAEFERAGKMLAKVHESGDRYPERLHAVLETVVEEIRLHASGRYHGRRLSTRQTEQQIARLFAELLSWQRVLAGELSPETLVYPRSRCG